MPVDTSKPMRVLYMTHTAELGGCNRSLRFLLENLPANVQRHLICPPGPLYDSFHSTGTEVIQIPGVSMFQSAGAPLRGRRLATLALTVGYMRHGKIIRAALQQIKPDLVHMNEWGMFHAAKICHKARIPVVMQVRCVVDRKTQWVKRLCERWAEHYVSALVAIDESVRYSIRECSNCSVIYNPAEWPENTPPHQVRAKNSPVHVTFLAGLQPYKGIWDLLECAKLLKDRKDIIFDIYGGNARSREFLNSFRGRLCLWTGLLRDSENEIKRWVEREKLQETVRLHGHVNASEAIFRQTDILAFPSRLNGIGRSVFEAGVYGIPAVACLQDKIKDIVEDGVNALVVDERDPAALAQAVRKLADDPDLCYRLGQAAARKYRTLFDARRIGAQMYELYQTLLLKPQAMRFTFVHQPRVAARGVAAQSAQVEK